MSETAAVRESPEPWGAGAPVVRLEGVHKSFGDNEVLKGIDLSVASGEVLTIIGPSGSGKSTLLRCVNLLEPLQSGRIFFEGEEITRKGVDVSAVRHADRDGLPAVQPLPAPDGDGQPDARHAPDPEASRARRPRRGRGSCWRGSGSRRRPASIRTSSPAVSSSGSRSRAR